MTISFRLIVLLHITVVSGGKTFAGQFGLSFSLILRHTWPPQQYYLRSRALRLSYGRVSGGS